VKTVSLNVLATDVSAAKKFNSIDRVHIIYRVIII